MSIIPRYFQEISVSSIIKAFFYKRFSSSDSILFLNSARSSIKWLLICLKLFYKKDYRVGVPCYSCFSITQSIIESGNTPILLDINPFCFELNEIIEEKLDNIDILIWINFFGFKYNELLIEIKSKFPKLIIIEDCSHVDFRDYADIYSSEVSQFSIFSFNFRKPITVGGGGALILKGEHEFNEFIKKNSHSLPYDSMKYSKFTSMFVKNIAYNRYLYPFFVNVIHLNRSKSFVSSISNIEIKLMNDYHRKLLNVQLRSFYIKSYLRTTTINYCVLMGLDFNLRSFGSNFYFPVLNVNLPNPNIDSFNLWENLVNNYELFGIRICKDCFPLTFDFFENATFFPAKYFSDSLK